METAHYTTHYLEVSTIVLCLPPATQPPSLLASPYFIPPCKVTGQVCHVRCALHPASCTLHTIGWTLNIVASTKHYTTWRFPSDVLSPLCLSASLPLCLSASLPLCLSASLPLCLSASMPLCLSASLPLCLYTSIPPCLPASLPPCLPPPRLLPYLLTFLKGIIFLQNKNSAFTPHWSL